MKKAVGSIVAVALAVAGLVVMAPSASAAGNYTFSVGDTSTDEGAGSASVPVSVSPAVQPGDSVSVTVNTNNGSATAGADYTDIAATVLTFVAGGPSTQFVSVTILEDAVQEGNEFFTADLSAPVVNTCTGLCSAAISDNQGIQTILDNDGTPGGFGFASDQSDVEGTGGFGFLDVFVTLSPAPPAGCTQTVQVFTTDGTAQAGQDYNAFVGTASFGPGVSQVDLFTTTIPDAVDEPNETLTWNLNPASTTSTCGTPPGVVDATSTHTILDDDPGPNDTTPTPAVDGAANVSATRTGKVCAVNVTVTNGDSGTVDLLIEKKKKTGGFAVLQNLNDQAVPLAAPINVTTKRKVRATISDAQGVTLGTSTASCPKKK
jgi:hypothetical protein